MKITICGSARFEREYHEWNKKLGLMGHISYSLMTFPSIEGSKSWYTEDEKETLDLAHLAKIEESDAILVLNKDGYIGESTKREIKWARMRNKVVYWLEESMTDQNARHSGSIWGAPSSSLCTEPTAEWIPARL